MSAGPCVARRARPQLKLVSSSLAPVRRPALIKDWRRVAAAIVACTHDLGRELRDGRWGNVHEALRERRELLDMLARMRLDVDGQRCLLSLEQAVVESERAIGGMLGGSRPAR